MVYFKNSILDGIEVLKEGPGDIIWYKMKKSHFGWEKDIIACVCYQPPSNSSSQNGTVNEMFDIMADNMAVLDEKYDCYFLVVGDLNTRTSNRIDFICHDEPSHLPLPDFYVNDVNNIPERSNQDTRVNTNGIKLLELCKMSNLRIVNGRVCEDAGIGSYTCCQYNGSSQVDLVLCSQSLLNEKFTQFEVLSQTEHSDHNPVIFSLDTNHTETDSDYTGETYRMKWDNDKRDHFVQSLSQDSCREIFDEMLEIMDTNIANEDTVNSAVNVCVNALRTAADPLFLKKVKYGSINNARSEQSGPEWADQDWYSKKGNFRRCANRYNRYSSEENRASMVNARSIYKSASWSYIQLHKNAQTNVQQICLDYL